MIPATILCLLAGAAWAPQDPAPAPDPEVPEEEVPSESEEVAAVEDEPPPVAEPAPGPPVFDHAFGLDEVSSSLARLAEEYPGLVRLQTIARSRAGREVVVLALTDLASGAPDEKPGLFFVDFRPAAGVYGAEAGLALAWTLAERAASDPTIAALLADYVLYLAPTADPDVRVVDDSTTPDPIEFDRNFPLGWLPDAVRPGSGAFPLAREETLALVLFLREHENVGLIVGVVPRTAGGSVPESAGAWRGAELPETDRAVLDALCSSAAAGTPLLPWGRMGSPGGGLFDYAYQALGVYAVAWAGPGDPPPGEVAAWTARVAAGTIGLFSRLPRLSLEAERIEELAPGLWEVDVAITNAGVVPTLSALAAERRAHGERAIAVDGCKLVAVARRKAADAPFGQARLHPAGQPIALSGATLGGGEKRWLRLVLEGESGTKVELRGTGPNAERMRLSLSLR